MEISMNRNLKSKSNAALHSNHWITIWIFLAILLLHLAGSKKLGDLKKNLPGKEWDSIKPLSSSLLYYEFPFLKILLFFCIGNDPKVVFLRQEKQLLEDDTLWCQKRGTCGKKLMVAHLGCVLCLKSVMTAGVVWWPDPKKGNDTQKGI